MNQTSEFKELVADVRGQIEYLRELGVDSLDVELPEFVERESIQTASFVAPEDKRNSNFPPSALTRATEIPILPNRGEPNPKPEQSGVPGRSRLASLPTLASLSKKVDAKDGTSIDEKIEPTEMIEKPIDLQKTELIVTEEPTKLLAVEMPSKSKSVETIEQIRAEIGPECIRCKLCELGRTKVVHSTGNFIAELMFVGEAPGADEDEQGFPFVGRAGRLLTDIMGAMGFARADVFIGNINRCRPPGNRAPEPDETVACKPFLQREIAVVRPKVIVVLGATAAQNLLETKVPIGKLRGNFHDYLGTKVMPTFHPAYLLRDPHKKREVWEDMKMVRDYLATQK